MDPTLENEGLINDKNTTKSNKDFVERHIVSSAAPLTLSPVYLGCRPSQILQLSQSRLSSSRDSNRVSSHQISAVTQFLRIPPPVPPKPRQPLKITRKPPPISPLVNSAYRPSTVLQSPRNLSPSSADNIKSSLRPLVAESSRVPPPVLPKPFQPPKITNVPPPISPKPYQTLKKPRTGQANGTPPLSVGNGPLPQPLLPSTSADASPPPTSHPVNSDCRPSTVLPSSGNVQPSSADSSKSSLHPLVAQSFRVPPPVAPKPCQPPKIAKVRSPVPPKPCQQLKNTKLGQTSGPQPLLRSNSPVLKPLLLPTSDVASPPHTAPTPVNSACRFSTILQSFQNCIHSSGVSSKASLHTPAVIHWSRVPPPVAPKPGQPPKLTKVPPPVAPKPCQQLQNTRPGQASGPQPLLRSNNPLSQPLLSTKSPVNSACRPSTVLHSSRNLTHSSGDSSKSNLHPLLTVTQSSRVPPSTAIKKCLPHEITNLGQGRKPPLSTMTGHVHGTSPILKDSGQNRRNNVVKKQPVQIKSGFDHVQVQQEKKNFLMIQSLVNAVGTEQMRKYFLEQTGIQRANVGQFLMREQHGSLKNIKIVADQKQIMFKKDADITRFDITIMMILIRCCCGVSQPDKFWINPRRKDNSKLANLVRIQKYRNTKIAHNADLRIPVAEFKKDWRKLTSIFKSFGVTHADINKYRQTDI